MKKRFILAFIAYYIGLTAACLWDLIRFRKPPFEMWKMTTALATIGILFWSITLITGISDDEIEG